MVTLKEIYEYRQMIFSLVRRELRGRYKGSVLGFLWTFINPLLQLVIYTIVFSVILKSSVDKYYLFLFVALIPWNFFSTSLTGGSRAVLSQQSLVTKIYFPREVLPIAYVTAAFVNMLYCFIVVMVVVVVSGTPLNFAALTVLPLIMIIEYFMALGIAMLSSAITVYFRDLEHILGVLSMAWIHLTPVMYSLDIVPDSIKGIFMCNPMTPVIVAYRDILYYSGFPKMKTLTSAAVFAVVIMIIGFLVFNHLKKRFAEEM